MLVVLMYLVPQYLEENLGAVKVHLTPDDLQEVRAEAERANATQGYRYPAESIGFVLADTPELK